MRRLESSEHGVSKSELIVFIKQSKIWKGIMESKAKTCTQSTPISKVNLNFILSVKSELIYTN